MAHVCHKVVSDCGDRELKMDSIVLGPDVARSEEREIESGSKGQVKSLPWEGEAATQQVEKGGAVSGAAPRSELEWRPDKVAPGALRPQGVPLGV